MRMTAATICLLALTGCVNVAKQVQLPDGSQGYTIAHCRSMNSCYTKAAEVCGGPYDIIGSTTTTQGSGSVVNGVGVFSTSSGYEMAVKCKAK